MLQLYGGLCLKRFIGVLLSLVMLLSICGCAQGKKADGKIQVVCTLFPYYDFVRQIGGQYVSPVLLVGAGKESHSFEPTPLDVITISNADIFLYNGGESEYWVSQILSSSGQNIPFVLSMMDCVDLLEEEIVEGMQTAVDHADKEHDHEDHDEIEYDEHIWTSPVIASEICTQICTALCQADPAHASVYEANLQNYIVSLAELDEAFRQVVSDGKRNILIFGDRFPLLYFCKTYDLNYRAAFHGCSSDTEPSLATLKYLIDRVEEENIPVIYTIELSSQKIAAAIAETTNAKVRTFYSCQTLSKADFDHGETYLSLMWKNVDVLKEGLS